MKVVVVDDHPLIREGLTHLFQRLDPDAVVLEANDCAEAFAIIDANPDTGLVLLDLTLPGMSGEEGLDILRAKHPCIPVVVLSAAHDSATVLTAIRKGAMGFIPKSHTSELLLGALQFILVHHGIYLPPDVFLQQPLPASEERRPAAEQEVTYPHQLGLTQRQAEILYLVLQGKPNKLICRELNLAEGTVKTHLTAVLRALNVTTRTEAVIAANRLRLVFKR